MPFIDNFATGIDNERKMVAAIADHQIIDDAAATVGEKRITLPRQPKAQYIDRHKALESLRSIGYPAGKRAQCDLPHMRDIEQTGGDAGMQMFLHHAQRVLDGHVVAGKRPHAGARLQVQRMEWRVFERGRGRSGMLHHLTARPRVPERAASRVKTPFKPVGTRPVDLRRKQSPKFKFDIWAPHQPCADYSGAPSVYLPENVIPSADASLRLFPES